GALSRPAAEKGLAPLADALVAGHTVHLAMDPTPEAVAGLARDVLRKLAELDAVEPGADLRRRRGPLGRVAGFLHTQLGGAEPTLLDELTEDARAEHRRWWRWHATRVNADLLARAPGLYTRLVLEALLRRSTVADERVRVAMEEWHRVRYPEPG